MRGEGSAGASWLLAQSADSVCVCKIAYLNDGGVGDGAEGGKDACCTVLYVYRTVHYSRNFLQS